MRNPSLILMVAMLASCSPAQGEKEEATNAQSSAAKPNGLLADKEVKAEKKTIEEAADAAAKLVEEETNAEIETLKTN